MKYKNNKKEIDKGDKMKKISLILVIAFSMTAIFAQGMRMGQRQNKKGFRKQNCEQGYKRQMMGRDMMSQLDLTSAQQDNIEKIRDTHQKKLIDIRAKLEKLQIDKRNAMKDAKFDKAENITGKISDQRAIIAKDRIKLQKEMYNILTKDQQAKFEKMRKEFHPMMRRKMERPGKPMMPRADMDND